MYDLYERALSGNAGAASTYNQSGYEPLNLENASFLNSANFDATDWGFNLKVKLKLIKANWNC